MCQRVILALAIANAPRLLMVDEPTSGLDVTISVQILDLLQSSVRELRSGLIVVSRDLGVVAHYCERVAVMQAGRIVEEAPVRTFFAAPRDPYSRRLLQAAAAARDTDLVAEAGSGGGAFAAAAPSAPVLELDGLVKRFPVKGGRTLTAVNDVSLTIARGESVALVGESGSGKTTVGRCILRLIEPTAGTVRYLGRDVSLLPQGQFRKLRSRIQMVFQDPFDSMDPRQRVEAALEEPLRLTGTMSAADRRQRVAELLRLVGLDASAAGLYPHQMSAGALQRVGIARAVATEPDLIVFDEPTSALDVSVRAEILNLLRDLQRRLGHGLPLHLARPHRRAPALPPHRHPLSRPAGRDRRDRGAVRQSAAPLFAGPALLGALPRPGAGALALRAHGRDPEPDRPADRLPAAHPLPDGDRPLQHASCRPWRGRRPAAGSPASTSLSWRRPRHGRGFSPRSFA